MALNAEFLRHIEEAIAREDLVAKQHFEDLRQTFEAYIRKGLVFELPTKPDISPIEPEAKEVAADERRWDVIAGKLGVTVSDLYSLEAYPELVRKLNFSTRTTNVLLRIANGLYPGDIRDFASLVLLSPNEILSLRYLGQKSLEEISTALRTLLPESKTFTPQATEQTSEREPRGRARFELEQVINRRLAQNPVRPVTLEELAQEVGVSRERVRQLYPQIAATREVPLLRRRSIKEAQEFDQKVKDFLDQGYGVVEISDKLFVTKGLVLASKSKYVSKD